MDTDAQQCPARGPGLTHVGLPRCNDCGQRVTDAHAPITTSDDRRGPIPAAFRQSYTRLRREGMTDQDAQALICFDHGLVQAPGAKPWTLRELVRLLFVVATAPSEYLQGACGRCPRSLPLHPAHFA